MRRQKLSKAEERRRLSPYGYVYGIGCGRTFVKVGMALHVPTRMKKLSAANPFVLTLRYCLSVPSDKMVVIEKWMHERLKKQRIYKEWFSGQPETFEKAFAEAMTAFEDVAFEHEMVGMREPTYNPKQPASMWGRKPFWNDEQKLVLPPFSEDSSTAVSAALSLP